MKEIRLTNGLAALVDDEDYERVTLGRKWQAINCPTNPIWYAARSLHLRDEAGQVKRETQRMHRLIMLRVNGKSEFFGYFPKEKEEEAARHWDRIALQHYGEFISTNFPRSDYE